MTTTNCGCRTPGECWHFSDEQLEEMRQEAAKVLEEHKAKGEPQ